MDKRCSQQYIIGAQTHMPSSVSTNVYGLCRIHFVNTKSFFAVTRPILHILQLHNTLRHIIKSRFYCVSSNQAFTVQKQAFKLSVYLSQQALLLNMVAMQLRCMNSPCSVNSL